MSVMLESGKKAFLRSDVCLANDSNNLHICSSKLDLRWVGKMIMLHRSLGVQCCSLDIRVLGF